MYGMIWLAALAGTLFVAGAYVQAHPAADGGDHFLVPPAAWPGTASGQTPDKNGAGLRIPDGGSAAQPATAAVAEKFDGGFYQKISNLIESDKTGPQTSHQKTQDPDGPRGASDEHDDELYYNVIMVVNRDGTNPDQAARQNKDSLVRYLETLGARDIVAGEYLSFVTASVPVSEIPGLSLREEIRQMGDGELPLTPQVDTARQTIRAAPSDLRQAVGWAPNGTGVTVAVIDTGINSTYLNDRVADRSLCWFPCREQPAGIIEGKYIKWVRVGPGYTLLLNYGPIYASHGTQVAAVLATSGMRSNNGMAPGVTLLDAMLNPDSAVPRNGLEWSYGRGADVVNISVGSTRDCNNLRSTTMIMNEAVDKGMVIVNGAGNSGYSRYVTVSSPACSHNLIAVGGINDRGYDLTMYTGSSRGPASNSEPRLLPHIVAPAVDIPVPIYTTNDTARTATGTSFAAPQVSAAAAILLQSNPELTPAEVKAALLLGADWTGPVPCTSAQYEQNNASDPCSFAMQPEDFNARNNATSLKILNNVGFGILNVAESLRYANPSLPHIMSDRLDAAAQTRTYEFDVTDTSRPVKVILTWMVNPLPVGDLNLEIITPDGQVINASSAYQTTEFAVFNPNVTGTYTIRVEGSGFESPDRPGQTFALARTIGFMDIAIDAVVNQTVNVHSTLRLNVTTQNATGPVRYSIDPLEGARIHPVTGHLVYVPVEGQQGMQNITVRAADHENADSATIRVAVGEPVATIAGIEVGPDGAHVATVDVGPGDITGMFAARTRADTRALSDPVSSNAGTNAARFAGNIPVSDYPRNNTLYYFAVWPGSSPDPDDRIYARFTPGQNGSEKIIPNPGTRPAHYVPDINTTIQTGRSVTVPPNLTDNDGNPVRITAVTNGTAGTAKTNGTAVTYTLNTTVAPTETITDTITYTVTDNAGLEVDGTIAITFEPFAISPVNRKTMKAHTTLRLDIESHSTTGPVRYSIDPLEGARIHPVTGHLVYLPPPGSEGPQTLTVRASDGISDASMDIDVRVSEPIGTLEYINQFFTNINTRQFRGNYTSNNPPDYLSWNAISGRPISRVYNSYYGGPDNSIPGGTIAVGVQHLYNNTDANRFWITVERFPPPYTLYFVTIVDDISSFHEQSERLNSIRKMQPFAKLDSNMFVRFEHGKDGYTVIPNPFTRPDPFAPSFDWPASIGMTEHITPDLVSFDGGTLNITDATTDRTRGTATHTNTTITYTPKPGATGTDTITYTVTDNRGRNGTGTINLFPQLAANNDTAQDDPPDFDVPPNDEGAAFKAIPEMEPFTFGLNVTNTGGIKYTLDIDLGDPPATGANVTQEGLFSWEPTEAQAPGEYTITITLDPAPAGRENVTRQMILNVTEVNQDPEFNITRTDHNATQGIEFTLNMNASDADLPEQEITCTITSQETGSVPAQINPQTCIITWTPADLGGHVIRVQAQDNLGGATPVAAININVGFNDVQEPVIILNNATQNPQIIELGDDYEELGATASDDDPRYTGMVTADASRVDTDKTGTYTVTYTAPADPAGRTPVPVTRNVTVQDTTKPVIALIGPSNQTVDYGGTYMEQNATVTDNDPGYTGTVSIDTPEIDSRIENATHTVTYSAPADDAGNVPDIRTRTLTIGLQSAAPNQNPVARDATLNITEDSGKSTVRPEIFDPDMSGTPVIISVGTPSKGEADFNATDNTITYRPGENEYGPDSFNYTIQDSRLGNATGTIHVSIEPVNDPPELQTIDDITLDELVLRTITLNATDVDNTTESLVWTHAGGPEGLDITDNRLTWTPAEDQGGSSYTFVITVSDGIDTDSQTVTFTVIETGQPPAPGNIAVPDGDNTVIAPVSNATIGRILEAYMSRGLVVYAGGPQPALAGSSGAGFLLAGIIINGTYTGGAGPADWNVTDPDDIAVFVREIGNVPPILSGTGGYTINAHEILTFAVSATDYNDTVSYRLSGAPDNATISEQGIFNWTPGSQDVGNYTFTITAYDRQGAADTESVTITVLPAGTPNESPTALDVVATVAPDGRVTIIPVISDPDGDPIVIISVTDTAQGTVTLSGNNIEYTAGPTPGTETITYVVTDSRGATSKGIITITIQ